MQVLGRRQLLVGTLAVVCGSWVAPLPSQTRPGGGESPRGFDGDGHADLVVGVPLEEVNGYSHAGAVNVVYGAAVGLSSAGNQLWHQDSLGIVGEVDAFEYLGMSITTGDFNGDLFPDVAIGVTGEDVGAALASGAVQVLYGGPSGLDANGNEIWSQNSPYVLDVSEENDAFGAAVTAGDFDGDGYDDLAVGVIGEDRGSKIDCGEVNVLYGSSAGLTSDGNIILHQDLVGTASTAETGDMFGAALATGDFDGDEYDDLAVGVPGEDNGGIVDAGAVHVFYGASSGIDPQDDWFVTQNTADIPDQTEPYDEFGAALATGDVDGDGYDELAIGAPGEDLGTVDDVGVVTVVRGSAAGLTGVGSQLWHQDIAGIADLAEVYDEFGAALATGDFDGDRLADLAVGIPGEADGNASFAGAVQVLYGTTGGLSSARNWWFHQGTSGMLDSAEDNDRFGEALASGDFNGDSYADLAVGVPSEDVASIVDAGAVAVVYGSSVGLTSNGNQLWNQDTADVEDECESNDLFGRALAATPPVWLFFDGFESGDTSRWSVAAP